MPPLKAFEQIDAGGVDSRSNPLNLPRNRALRCLNWVPKQAGFWELRWGYSTVTMSTVSASAIHSMFPYRTWDGHKYVLFMSNDSTLKTLDTATGTVTTPTVKGTAIASTAKGAGFFAANRFHYGNGTDQKWFDGTTWRDSGLRALTSTEVQNVAILEGVRELTTTQASAITLTAASGGSFTGDTLGGRLIYVAIFDISSAQLFLNEIGPATISVGSGRISIPNSDKLTVAMLPDLSGTDGNWVKLIAGTVDGGDSAWFFTNTSTAITSVAWAAFNQLTITSASHGLSNGDAVILTGTPQYDGIYSVQNVVDSNHFTVYQTVPNNQGSASTGTVKRIVAAGNSATSVDVLAPTMDMNYQVNQNRGVAISSVGGPNPGYQFAVSLYNPNGGGHVGDSINIGARFAPSSYRVNVHIYGLPSNADITDSEQVFLVGRTIDGGAVPYVCTDPAGNWATLAPQATITNGHITQGNLDANHALPTRNGIIPPQCNMFCVAGDFAYAADTGSPYLRRSGDMSQNTERGDTFTGRAEQSWAADDIDTFPTGEALTGMFEVDQEVLCGTLHDTAISVNLAGIEQWVGPWEVGIAGRRAGTKCGSHGFYWVSGDKQLCTLSQGVPVAVSEEYEMAELAQIGDQYLSTVECTYFRSATLGKDELRIEFQRQDGSQYTVIHDFKLREIYNPPGSIYGQGYSSTFGGPLGTVFTSSAVRDGNGKLQIYAGASSGQIYELYSGADDVGNQYAGDLILLVNGGPDRPNVPFIDFYGDQNIIFTLGRNLSSSLSPAAQWGFTPANDTDDESAEVVQGAEQDFLYRVKLVPPEVQRLYIRIQLSSHSADGNLNLNSPPHIPLENYGRLYEMIPTVGDERYR